MERILIQGDFQPTLEAALIERVRLARGSDPLAPIRIVVPSNLLRVHLRRLLGGAFPHLNVRVETLTSLASDLSFAGRAERGCVPLPPLAAQLLAESVVRAAAKDSTFAPLRTMPGFATRLLATIRDLRDAGIAPSSLVAAIDSPKVRDFAALYSEFERRRSAANFCDDAEMFTLAIEEIRNDSRQREGAALFVYGFYDFVVVQRRLVEALLEGSGGVVLTPISDSRNDRFEYGRPFLERFAQLGFENESPPGETASLTRRRVRILAPRFSGSEPREVMREVLALVDEKLAPHEIGILFRQRAGTEGIAAEARRLERTCPGSTLAFFQQGGSRIALRADARALLLFVDVLVSRIARRETMAYLDAVDDSSRASAYARLARKANIRGGMDVEEWRIALSHFEARARRNDLDREFDVDEDDGDVRRAVVEREARDATKLRVIIDDLAKDADRLHAAKDFAAATAVVRDAFRARMAGAGSHRKESRESLGALDAIFSQLAVLDLPGVAYELETFQRLMASAVEAATERCGAFENGLFVGGLLGSRGLPFRAVILPSLEEGVFPRRAAPDPILSDSERRAIARSAALPDVRLPLAETAASEEKLLFHLACAASQECLVLSCARFEDASDKPVVPSSAWRGALEEIHGGPLPEGPPWQVPDLAPLFRIGSALSETGAAASSLPIDLEEWDRVTVARAARTNDAERARFIAEVSPTLVDALRGETARNGKTFGANDGMLTTKRARERASLVLESAVAPTTLENYAKCPFTVFARHVVAVDPSDPRAREEMDFRQRGRVIHKAAQLFFTALRDRKEPWPLARSRRMELRRELLAFLDSALKDSLADSPVPAVIVEGERRRLVDDMTALLDYEIAAARPARPAAFEARFGDAGQPEFVLDIEGRPLRLRGSIDRIDFDPSSGKAIVVDYKTAKKALRDVSSIDGGRRMQLPIYALAVMAMKPNLFVERAEYFFCTEEAGGRRAAIDAQGYTGAAREKLDATLAELARGMRDGAFFADPSDGNNCNQCDYDLACGLSPILEARYAKKQDDASVAALQRLRQDRPKTAKKGKGRESKDETATPTGGES